MNGLYLDGMNDLLQTIKDYSANDSSYFHVKRDCWLRITILVHTALTLIRTITMQLFRGTGDLLSGIIHFDGERILMGLNDYLSLLIQSVSLPVLGCVVFVSPKTGHCILQNICFKLDTTRRLHSEIVYYHEDNPRENLFLARKGLSEAIMGILGGLSAFFYTLTYAIENCLSFSFGDLAREELKSKGCLIAIAPLKGISNSCSQTATKAIYEAHRIDIEFYNPSPLFYF